MSRIRFRILAGIFFISSATLCLEITLTRYFSISQNYHFAFLVISIAFLGYGASGSFLFFVKVLGHFDLDKFLSVSSLLFSLSVLVSFVVSNSIPFDFIRLSFDKSQIYFIFLYYFFLSLPFFFAGLTISVAVTRLSNFVNKIYFFDLLGAGTGSFLSALIFLPRGEKGVFLLICLLALLAAFLFSPKHLPLLRASLLLFLAAEVLLFISSPSWLSFRISPFKALPLALKYPQAKHYFTKWNAISRLDILESPATRYAPGLSLLYEERLPPQIGLSLDGGELSAITQFENLHDPALQFLSFLPSSFAYFLLQKPSTLIIEPKGGLDVLASLYFKASQVKVIESNPLLISLLRTELGPQSGNLYNRRDIHLVSGQVRAMLRKNKEFYDLIIFSLTDVFGSSGTGLYGFGENYLYTVESFSDLLQRLSPQGIIAMTLYLLPPPRQEIRLLATWMEALEQNKMNPSSHLIALRSWGTISYFIKKSPFEAEDIQKLKAFTEERFFDIVYYPGVKAEEQNIYTKLEEPLYDNLPLELLSADKRKELYKKYLFDIKPVRDNRPFFYNSYKFRKLRATYKAFGSKWLPFLQGEFFVPLLVVQSVFISFLFILFPFLVFPKTLRGQKCGASRIFFYFSLIGAAFMFVEMTFIQKFILFLGHPLYSMSAIIFSLLLSSGLGSLFSKRILGQNLQTNLKKCLLFSTGLILIYLFLLPLVFENFISLDLRFKIPLTLLLILPLGFVMGFAFPSGIRLLDQTEKKLIPWAWATNAFSSVVNSVVALMIAFWGGYNLVLILGAASYLVALPFLSFADHRNKANT